MNVVRSESPADAALVWAVCRAADEMSVPNPCAFGSSDNSASKIAPEPVPRSAIRNWRSSAPPARNNSSASSTTVSVSGRGTSVAAESFSGSPQNSLWPRMRATGSPRRRRCAKSSSRSRFVRRELPLRGRDQAGEIEAKHCTDEQPRIEFGGSIALDLKRAVSARARGFVEDSVRSSVVPANAGTHTPRPHVWVVVDISRNTSACGYGSLRSQGRPSALTPRRPGRRVGRPDARSSARRSVRRALRPRSPAAICRASG